MHAKILTFMDINVVKAVVRYNADQEAHDILQNIERFHVSEFKKCIPT